jgi:hypothetical protein
MLSTLRAHPPIFRIPAQASSASIWIKPGGSQQLRTIKIKIKISQSVEINFLSRLSLLSRQDYFFLG